MMRNFGIALDIDGVLFRGTKIIRGAKEAIYKLERNRIPFVFITNGGGTFEKKKAAHLSQQLCPSANIGDGQVILCHTPYKSLVSKYANRNVLILGKKECLSVANEYGFSKTTNSANILLANPTILPNRQPFNISSPTSFHLSEKIELIEAIMVFHDPEDWTLDIQLVCDLLTPDRDGQHIPFYSCNADIVYNTEHPLPRFTQGAFVSACQHLYKNLYKQDLKVNFFGKPFKIQYEYAERLLDQQAARLGQSPPATYFGIGDNPLSDIKGANEAGSKWKSILVRTGIFNSNLENDVDNPADFVVEDVEKAVDLILQLELDFKNQ